MNYSRLMSLSKRKTERHFTLVEMLVVVGIMGLLMYISMPAFAKLAKGYGIEAGTTQVKNALEKARATAILNSEYVALLMPHRDEPGATLSDKYIHKAYRLCYVDGNAYDDDGTAGMPYLWAYQFKSWIPGEEWEHMPTGTSILEADQEGATTDDIDVISTYHQRVDLVNCTDIGGASNVQDIHAVVFKPTGEIDKSVERYVTMGESTYSGGNIVHTNKLNRKILKIDQYTGRISYGNK